MDAAAALADLTEISSQVEAAAVLDADGALLASTHGDEPRAARLAETARELLAAAAEAPAATGRELTQLEVALRGGSVFVVRHGGRVVVATTAPDPPSGLVLYDLRACLRALDEAPKPKPRARRRTPAKQPAGGDDAA